MYLSYPGHYELAALFIYKLKYSITRLTRPIEKSDNLQNIRKVSNKRKIRKI